MIREIRAEMESRWRATLSRPSPLRYAAGASSAEDYPAFVRAASAIRRWQGRCVMVQDDVNVLGIANAPAVLEPEALRPLRSPFPGARAPRPARANGPAAEGSIEALLLPRGEGGLRSFDASRGNKRSKLDLEAALVLPDGRLVAFGFRVTPGSGAADRRRARQGSRAPRRTRSVSRGCVCAASLRAPSSTSFLACAEASPDAVADGEVVAMQLGLIDGDRVRLIAIADALGQPCRIKLEGIEARDDAVDRFDVVADVDDPGAAALGATLELARA
jgi:hypothetical protein